MALHKNIPYACNHIVHSLEYVDSNARTTATGFTTSDIGRIAMQLDDSTFWILSDNDPLTWIELGGTSSLTLSGLDDINLTSGLDIGDLLGWDGNNWIPTGLSDIDHGSLSGLDHDDHSIYHTDSRAATWFSSQTAGGGLYGTYPNPEVSGLTDGHLADDAAHGNRGGGTLHDIATQSLAGFMSTIDKVKLDNISDNGSGDDWCSGLLITEHDPNNLTIDYTSGSYIIDGISKSISSGGNYDLTNGYGGVDHFAALGSSQRRRVLIYVDNDEAIKSVGGPVSSTGQTQLPDIPDDTAPLAYILIRKNGSGTSMPIKNNRIKDLRYSKSSITIDELVSISITDETSDFLINKLSNNGNVAFTIENPGSAETIKADVIAGGIIDSHVAAANKDGTAGTASMRTLGTGAQQACAGNDSRLAEIHTLDADQLLSPTTSDWSVNALASLSADSNNSALSVRLFDDTTEEGIGFLFTVPAGVTNLKIKLKSRAETAPVAARTVGLKLYNRGIPDNSAVESWSAGTTLADVDIPANEYWQYDEQTISLSTLGITAGELTQFELTRINPTSGTELSGDWTLLQLGMEFT